MQGSVPLPKPLALCRGAPPPPGRIWAGDLTDLLAGVAQERPPQPLRLRGRPGSDPDPRGCPDTAQDQTSAGPQRPGRGPRRSRPCVRPLPSLRPRLLSPSFDVVEERALRLHGEGKQRDLEGKAAWSAGARGTCQSAHSNPVRRYHCPWFVTKETGSKRPCGGPKDTVSMWPRERGPGTSDPRACPLDLSARLHPGGTLSPSLEQRLRPRARASPK